MPPRLSPLEEDAFRGWHTCWLAGYRYNGTRRHAFFQWRKKGRYWLCDLNYYKLDLPLGPGDYFKIALERVGPDLTGDLWIKHHREFSRQAVFAHGGWCWWGGGHGLSEPFVHALRDLLVDRYQKARALYESWLPDRTWAGGKIVPQENPQALKLRAQAQEEMRQREDAFDNAQRIARFRRRFHRRTPERKL
jgi:hypothetical protein